MAKRYFAQGNVIWSITERKILQYVQCAAKHTNEKGHQTKYAQVNAQESTTA